jgi:hypothetical protein
MQSTIPRSPVGTLKTFKSLDDFLNYFDNLEVSKETITQGYGTYEELLNSNREDTESLLADESWFGKPAPLTYDEGMRRTRYQLMDEFNDIYSRYIVPRLDEILKQSKADLALPAYKYNDLGLGLFDFNKASTGLVPKYEYFSFKKKEMVEGFDVATIQDGTKYKYILKSDNSPCVLVPYILSDDKELLHKVYQEIYDGGDVFSVLKKYNLRIGGKSAFGSMIKKSYILKENVLKPKNAIRLFIKVGQNGDITGEKYKWAGYAAIGIAKLLSTLGNYSVNIIAVVGNGTRINLKQDGNLVDGYRFWGINLKSFEDTLDASSLLYVASDPSFFRLKVFNYLIKNSGYYKDYFSSGIGHSADVHIDESMIFNEYGKRDKLFFDNGQQNDNSQFLYYIIGWRDDTPAKNLHDIYSLDEMNKAILDIGLDVVNKNKEALQKLMGN